MIAIGCDHGGYELAVKIMKDFDEKKIEYKFFGTFDGKSIDYPDTAYPVATSVASGESEKGILVCGTGIGMSIAANKVANLKYENAKVQCGVSNGEADHYWWGGTNKCFLF